MWIRGVVRWMGLPRTEAANRLRSACGCLKLRTRDLKPDEKADSDSCDSVSIQDFQTTDLFFLSLLFYVMVI